MTGSVTARDTTGAWPWQSGAASPSATEWFVNADFAQPPSRTELEHDAKGDVTYVPGGESLIWEPVGGEPFDYHFINYYRGIQKRLRAVRDEASAPTPLASLEGLVSDIRTGFAKDGGERLVAICLAEALRRAKS